MELEFTAVIQREGEWFVALCPELDIASQGETIEEARANLIEALEGFLLSADDSEIQGRTNRQVYVSRVRIAVDRVADAG